MLEKLANVFRVPDLRKRILFTLGLLAVYRLGGHIPTPGINADKLAQFFDQNRGSFLGFIDLFSGGQLRRLTVFALGIMPYITASIILQLMTVVYEPLAKLQKEGELGRKKITQWTRYLTLGLSAVQSLGIAFTLQTTGRDFVVNPGIGFVLMTMLTLTTGQRLHHVAGRADYRARRRQRHVAADFRRHRGRLAARRHGPGREGQNAGLGRVHCACYADLLVVLMVAVVAFIVFVERSERRIPVQYAKRVVGRKIMGGQSTHLPLRVNSGGVMPVIFASSVLTLPQTVGYALFKDNRYFGPMLQRVAAGASRCTHCCMRWDHLLRLLLRVDCLQPERKLRTTCASTAVLFPAFARARARRITSTTF